MDYRRGAARKKWDYGLSPENCLLGLWIKVISRSGLIIGLWIIAAKRLGLMADYGLLVDPQRAVVSSGENLPCGATERKCALEVTSGELRSGRSGQPAHTDARSRGSTVTVEAPSARVTRYLEVDRSARSPGDLNAPCGGGALNNPFNARRGSPLALGVRAFVRLG